MLNDRILVISDLQCPYHHPLSFKWLAELKKEYKPTRIISVGDEVDWHALNFHGINTDLDSPEMELLKIQMCMQELESGFPKIDIMKSNHGSLPIRKAHAAGRPTNLIKSYADIYGVNSKNWIWHNYLDIEVNKRKIRFVHSYESNVLAASKNIGMSLVQGHHHSKLELYYWNGNFAATVGCLIDDSSPAFNYNKTSSKRPVLGSMVIIKGHPILLEFPYGPNFGGLYAN